MSADLDTVPVHEDPGSNLEVSKAKVQVRACRFGAWVAWMLILGTLLVVAGNWFHLSRKDPLPTYRLQIDSNAQALELVASMTWPQQDDAESIVRPLLKLQQSGNPSGALTKQVIPLKHGTQQVGILIEIPDDCQPGEHQGRLVVSAPGLHASWGIHITVRSVWQDWKSVWIWLIFAASVYGFLYLLFVVMLPTPNGSLVVVEADCPGESRDIALRSRTKFLAFLAPWTRNTVLLSDVLPMHFSSRGPDYQLTFAKWLPYGVFLRSVQGQEALLQQSSAFSATRRSASVGLMEIAHDAVWIIKVDGHQGCAETTTGLGSELQPLQWVVRFQFSPRNSNGFA